MNRSKSRALDLAEIKRLNAPEHEELISQGYKVGKSSRIWFRKDGSYTIRICYRKPKAQLPLLSSITYVMRGVVS